jgi:cell wall-associated NlpC family hydrolase
MRKCRNIAFVGLVCGLCLCVLEAQDEPARDRDPNQQLAAKSGMVSRTASTKGSSPRGRKTERALSSDDRRAVIAVALRSKTPRYGERDCSHLVHAIFQRAGFPYAYATSDDLYDGVEGFQRVSRPKPGDLVVWRGHVGIVIRPSRHAFFSFLHAGPGIDDYRNRYWRGRGQPRFYRYMKNATCTGPDYKKL